MMKIAIRNNRTLLIVFILFVSFLCGAYLLNTNFLTIKTSYITIHDENFQLQGLLYKPDGVSSTKPAPAVVLAHGIANSKEVVSGFALELAKRGFVTLALDEAGHGNSEGNWAQVEKTDPSLGVLSAVNWLKQQNYVDQNKIGVIGHSMGAESAYYAGLHSTTIKATILIGGGVNGTLTSSTGMNATNPHNLLVIIGKFDVLFNVPQLQNSQLERVFNTTTTIQLNKIYGSFTAMTARKLVTVPATHLFEVMSPDSIRVITDWLSHSLNYTIPNPSSNYSSFLLRDFFLLLDFVLFIWFVLLLSKVVITKYNIIRETNMISSVEKGNKYLLGLTWGILSLVLFVPSITIGTAIVFPPVVFGSFFAFWLLFTSLSCLLLLFLYRKVGYITFATKELIHSLVSHPKEIYAAFGIILFMYTVTIFMEEVLQLNFKIFIPVLNEIGSFKRIIIFLIFIPYTLLFFFAQNVYFFMLSDYNNFKSSKTLLKQLLLLVGPFLLILGFFYIPIGILNTVLIPGTLGFFTEFLVPTVGVFIITTVTDWYYYKETNSIVIGLIVNVFMVTLTLASLFPIVF